MWIFFNNSFLSIVEHEKDKGFLLVRARHVGDIKAIFPKVTEQETPENDYLVRAMVPRELVVAKIAEAVDAIDYDNFKKSVKGNSRHNAYLKVWQVMANWQYREMPERLWKKLKETKKGFAHG